MHCTVTGCLGKKCAALGSFGLTYSAFPAQFQAIFCARLATATFCRSVGFTCAMQDRGGFQGMVAQNKGAVSSLLEKTSCPDRDGIRGLGSGHPQPAFGLT